MQKIYSSLQLAFFLFTLVCLIPTHIFAHAVGQPPFLKISQQYAGYYVVPESSSFFEIPQDQAPQTVLVGTTNTFEIETTTIGTSFYVTPHTKFIWDFGDHTTFEGIKTLHAYQKPGTYIISIQELNEGEPTQLIESAKIDVLPNPQYQLPKAVISVNQHEVVDPNTDSPQIKLPSTVHFSADGSMGVKPLQFIWDFGDSTSTTAAEINHPYGSIGQTVFPVLRVIDANGFYIDTSVQLVDLSFFTSTTSASNVHTSTPQLNQSARTLRNIFALIFETNTSNPFLFAFVIGLVFIAGGLHALSPGHGKGLMATFLIGKKGSRIGDVILLALSMTFTHTIVIFCLGFLFLWIDQKHTITEVLPYFEKGGALLVVVLAARLIFSGINQLLHYYQHSHHHEHHHDHEHTHQLPINIGRKTILFAGFSGGIVPCTDAFALLLLFATQGHVALGIFYVFIFSIGLSLTIVALGLLLIIGKQKIAFDDKLGRFADTYTPIVSGIILMIIAIKLLWP